MNVSLDATSSSFTALLELPPTQVVKLLDEAAQCHEPPYANSLQLPASADLEFEPPHHHSIPDPPIQIDTPKPVPHKINGKKKKKKIKEEDDEVEVPKSLLFPFTLLFRVTRGEGVDSIIFFLFISYFLSPYSIQVTRGFKSKKSKIEEHQLPYVHVRARRGQATDSHSLAERARREKINARMKLLQELVPGCSKITGIALVLDEIINHVQALQRQVEFLSMQLSAVNPRVEFNLDHFLNENTSFVEGNFLSMHPPLEWLEPQANGFRRSFVQQWQCDAYQQSQWPKEENHLESVATADTTLLRTDYSQEPGTNEPSNSGNEFVTLRKMFMVTMS
ncbi:unnamed protein product [Rhodiola kirilowii]